MKKLRVSIIKRCSFISFCLLLFLTFFYQLLTAQTIYQHNFGTTAISGHPYIVLATATPVPGIINSNLLDSAWTNSNSAWGSSAGSSGQAITLTAGTIATKTITLFVKVKPGFQASVTSFNFWRQRSGTGPTNWAMTINGISVGSGTTPTSGAAIGTTTVSNAVSNQTGMLTVLITLTGITGTAGTFRIDDFTLNGSVTPAPTLSSNMPTSFGNVCINTVPGSNTFTLTGTDLTSANVTVGPLSGFQFSQDNSTFSSSITFTLPGPGAQNKVIYIRFLPIATLNYDGNIPVSGGGAAAIAVPVSGSGVNTVPVISNGITSLITSNSATVGAAISSIGCSAITGYGIEYSTTPGFANGTGTIVPSSNLSGGNFSVNLSALAPPGQIFYYHTYATNGGGTIYGTENSFTLLNNIPSLSVPSSGAGSLSGFGSVCINTNTITNSFSLSGSVLNGGNISIGPLTGFTFATNSSGPFSNTITLTTAGTDYSYTGAVLTGCLIFVKFSPTAVNSFNGAIPISGAGAPPLNIPVTGSGVNTSAIVTSDFPIVLTTTSAVLQGTISNAGCGVLLDYGIEYGTAPFAAGSGTVVPSGNLSGSQFSSNIPALLPSTTYYFYAYATTNAGTVYGSMANFTTLKRPVKLAIISISPISPIALAPFSITIQAQDAANTATDVDQDTNIQFALAAGTGVFTFPNSNAPAATMYNGANTITIDNLSYDLVQNLVALTCSASSGMALTTSAPFSFNVIDYPGSDTSIWQNPSGSAWLTGANWTTNPGVPGASSGFSNDVALFSSLAATSLSGCGINMTTTGGDFHLGSIYFTNTFSGANAGLIGNSSGSVNGTLNLYGTAQSNVGNVGGNNHSSLLIANYSVGNPLVEIRNSIGGSLNMTLNLINAGSFVAGSGRTISITTLMTGSQTLTLAGGGNFSFTPSGAAAVNSFSGSINVNHGTYIAGNAGALRTTAPFNILSFGSGVNAGKMKLNGNSLTIGGLSSSGTAGLLNTIDNGTNSATLTVNTVLVNTFGGSLNDAGTGQLSLIKTGTGTLNLNGFNQYTGTTIVNGGTLRLNYPGGGTLPSTNSISVNGGTIRISSDQTIKDLTITGGGTLQVDVGVNLVITGIYSAAVCNIRNDGKITLQGSALQSFPGTSANIISMNNLEVNNFSGVIMNKSLNIAGVLTLSNGLFTVGGNSLTINNPISANVNNLSANNISSVTIAGTVGGVDLPASVNQLNNFTVTNTIGSTLQGNLSVSGTLFLSTNAGLVDADYSLNGTGNLIMTGGNLQLGKNGVIVPQLTGAYSLTGGTVTLNGLGQGTDAQTVRPVNYFNLTDNPTGGDRILSSTGVIGISNNFIPSTNNYTITGSTVDFNKAAGQNLPAFTFYNLKLSGGSAVVKGLIGNIAVKATFTFAANTRFSLNNFDATLLSDASGTANMDVMPTVNSIIYGGTGRFIVERYIPTGIAHGKSWQLLSTPTTGQSMKDAWQEGNAPLTNTVPFKGTIITSEKPGAVGRGFDFYTPAGPSIKTYNSVLNRWDGIDNGILNTSAIPVANKKGYMIFVRGDRSVQTSTAPANVTTLRTRGRLFIPGADAPPSTNVAAGKLESVGNPYASAIDFPGVVTTSTGIDTKYYVWDPLIPGSNGYGAYQTISSVNGYKPVPGGTANYNAAVSYSKIQSGQAFFVYSTGGGTVNFAENNKLTGSNMVFRNAVAAPASIRLSLYGSNGSLADGNLVVLDESFSNSIDGTDAKKLENFGENIGILRNGTLLAIDARKPVIALDTVFYQTGNLRNQQYRIELLPEHIQGRVAEAFWVDQFLGTRTMVNTTGSTNITVTISNEPGSKAADRFYMVFKPLLVLPVQDIRLIGTVDANHNAALTWKVTGESEISEYQLEKSTDGVSYNPIQTETGVLNTGNPVTYYHTDNQLSKLGQFYRVKSLSRNGSIHFSNQLFLQKKKSTVEVNIYPNPITNHQIRIQLLGSVEGIWDILLYNSAGKLVMQKNWKVSTKDGAIVLAVNSSLPAGIYHLKMQSGKIQLNHRVVIR